MGPELLIEELTPTQSHLIEEASTDGKNVWLNGIFMQADIKNRNKRNYPLSEISRVVAEAQQRIKESNGIFGELDHPQTLNINLDRISHAIVDLRMEGANAIGRAKLLPTPMGNIARALVDSGVRLGVSSRGAGTVSENGDVNGFNFVTVDIVATPSAPGAMPNSVYESLDMHKSGRRVITLAEQMREDPEAQKYFKREIEKFLRENLFAKK
jgi:hypothetical protein